jgi:hypothetical protein
MVRDPEVIEQWKNESRQKKQYRLKPPRQAAEKVAGKTEETPPTEPAPEVAEPSPPTEADEPAAAETSPPDEVTPASEPGPAEEPAEEPREEAVEELPKEPQGEAMSEEDARHLFRETHLPKMVQHGTRAVVPAEVAKSMEDSPVKRAIREAWFQESRFPLSMSLAMRPAFRHMRLHMFKTNRKHVFVTAVKPKPLDPGVAVETIRNELTYLHDHPGCTRKELVEALRPDAALESPEVAEVVSNLRWLVEKGHVIEFYDGRLSVPSEKTGSVETTPEKR